MFVRLRTYLAALQESRTQLAGMLVDAARVQGENRQLTEENTRLRSDLDWFKLHYNACQRERAQLIYAAIGVKVGIPEFQVKTNDAGVDALQELPDLSRVGGDAVEEEPEGRPTTDAPGDYTMLPGYERTR